MTDGRGVSAQVTPTRSDDVKGACSYCSAKPGERCRTAAGTELTSFHASRRKSSTTRVRRWSWLDRDGGPGSRLLNALLVIVTAVGVFVSIASIIVASQAKDAVATYNNNVGNTTFVENYYEDADGAPGQANPQADRGCGGIDSELTGGWGPDRPIFSLDYPPNYTTLNAIRDNPNVGDERGLMRVRDLSIEGTTFDYEVEVVRDHTYRVMMYVENSTIDDVEELASLNTRVMVTLPTCSGYRIASNGFIESSTAFPSKIWGGVTFTSDELFNLRYVEGSARLTSNAYPGPEGLALDEQELLTSKGVALGFEDLDGVVLPGYKYAMYIEFDVQPQFAPK